MRKYVLLFCVNALIFGALSVNAFMTLAASCSPSGACTDAVGPLTWIMAFLPLVIILGAGIALLPRALRGMKAGKAERATAKADRAEARAAMPDSDAAMQSRLRRLGRNDAAAEGDETDVACDTDDDTVTSGALDTEITTPAPVAADEVFGNEFPAADTLACHPGDSGVGDPAAGAVAASARPVAEDATAAAFDGDGEDSAGTGPVDANGRAAVIALPHVDNNRTDIFPRLEPAARETSVAGAWSWLVSGGQVVQLRPAAQTGFPWAAATIAEMASAIIEQSQAQKLGDFLPEAEAWIAVATELPPPHPIVGEDAESFVGWINDVAVHCHLIGSPVTVGTLLMQAMDRLAERAEDDVALVAILPDEVQVSQMPVSSHASTG